jgi:hypothetical protein
MVLVSYDIKDGEIITLLRNKAKEHGDTHPILPDIFALDTQYNNELAKELMKIVEGTGRICITEIHRNTMNGWFGEECVKWINSKTF